MPSGNITITPGRVLVDGPVALEQLNDLGNPTARVDEGAIGPRELAPEAFTSDNFADGSFAVAKLAPGAEAQVIKTVGGVAVWAGEDAADTQRYAFRAVSVGNQAVPTNDTATKLLLQSEVFDTGNAFNPALARYVAAVTGVHHFAFHTQADNDTGQASTMQVSVRLVRNGTFNDGGPVDNTPSPSGNRWFGDFASDVLLQAGDYVELYAAVVDTVGSGQVQFSNLIFSGHLVMPV